MPPVGWASTRSPWGRMAVVLNRSGSRPGEDLILKFVEHFAAITDALDGLGLWDETDGLYYDRLKTPSGATELVKVRSMVGIIPALAAAVITEDDLDERSCSASGSRTSWTGTTWAILTSSATLACCAGNRASGGYCSACAGRTGWSRLFANAFDESEFLSPYGLRALSAYHRDHPYTLEYDGIKASIDYEPAESTTPMFGGNSNWRGPIWFPLNYLMISVLERYHRFYGDDYTIEYPTGSGKQLSLDQVAADLADRLISIFTRDPTADGPASAGPSYCRPIPHGTTTSYSASTSTATTGPRSARSTKPAGPA